MVRVLFIDDNPLDQKTLAMVLPDIYAVIPALVAVDESRARVHVVWQQWLYAHDPPAAAPLWLETRLLADGTRLVLTALMQREPTDLAVDAATGDLDEKPTVDALKWCMDRWYPPEQIQRLDDITYKMKRGLFADKYDTAEGAGPSEEIRPAV